MKKILAILMTFAFLLSYSTSAQITDKPYEIGLSTVRSRVLILSPQVFEDKLNIPKGVLSGIAFTSLPDKSEGVVLVGLYPVQPYEVLNREQIEKLSVVFFGEQRKLNISFIPQTGDEKTSISANATLHMLDKENLAPKTESFKLDVIQNIAINSIINATDPENDEVAVKLISPPKKGKLIFSSLNMTYTPYPNEVGTDSFTFAIVDTFGNTSKEAKCTINIAKASFNGYLDMKDNPYHYQAVRLAEAGVFQAEKTGQNYFFNPKKELTQSEFLLLVLSTLGKDVDLENCVNTGLKNDSAIPNHLKSYIEYALDKKIISGETFEVNAAITEQQASIMIKSAVNTNLVSQAVFAESLPNNTAHLTRERAAGMIYRLYQSVNMTKS